MYSKKITIFLLTLIVLLISIAAVSANDNQADSDLLSQCIESDTTDNIESYNENVINTKTEKNLKESYDPYTKQISSDFAGKIFEVNADSYDKYFDEEGYLTDDVNDGDILDIQGVISDKSGININKKVNLISTTKDGVFSNVSIFTFKHDSSYSNMTDITVKDSKFFVENATSIIINNVSVTVINASQGIGTGIFSIRDASDHITFANSNVYCENNGGTSLGVIAAAQYCTFVNSTFKGVGNVGNLVYLTTYNVKGDMITNDYNKFINNTIEKTDEESAISYGIGLIGKHNEFINNTVNTKGTGITLQWGSKPDNCTNNYFEGNYFSCAGAAIFPNSTYVNNTFLTANALTVMNNTNITGCMFNNSVSLQNNVSFINNVVYSPTSNYAVSIVGNTSTVKNNGLTAKTTSGNDAVSTKYDNCIIEDNDNRRDFKKSNEYLLTEDTYADYFSEDGDLIVDIDDGDIFLVSGELYSKVFYINNKKVIFKNFEENPGILINPDISVVDDGQITIDGLQIYADNDELEKIIYIESSGNIINNTFIHQETTAAKAHSVIVEGDNNIISNSKFELYGPSNGVDFDSTPNLASMINIVVSSSNNIIKNNTFKIIATTETGWGTVEALTFQNDYADIKNNTIEYNQITGEGTDYIYGINFGGRVYDNVIKNNIINITSLKYANAIQFMTSPASNNKIIGNKINITAGESDGNVAYGIIFSSWSSGLFENNQICDNNVTVTANQAYGIESFSSVATSNPVVINTTICNNTVNTIGVYASGIAVMGTTYNISLNHIECNGQTNQTGSSADYIKPTTAGIILQKVSNSTVYDNFIGVENGPTNKILQNSNNITIEENILLSSQGMSSDSIVINSGDNIIIGVNYPIEEAQITVTGDYIPGEKSVLTVNIVDKNGNIIKKANGTVTVSIYEDEKLTLENGQAEFTFASDESSITGAAFYAGNEYIPKTENKFTLSGTSSVSLKFEDSSAVIGEDLPLIVYVESGKDEINEGTVIFYVEDEEIVSEDVKDNMVKTSCNINNNWYKKDITITAKYTDSKTYPETQTTMKPTIIIPTSIEASFDDAKIGQTISGAVRVIDTVSNLTITPKITSYVNGKEAGTIAYNGQIQAFTFTYKADEVGVCEIKIVFDGGENGGYTYNASQKTQNINIEGYDTDVEIADIEATKGKTTPITITVTSPDTQSVENGTVTLIDENDNILAVCEVKDGQASCEITFNSTATSIIKAKYESTDNYYKQSQTQANLLVKDAKINPLLVINPVTITKGQNTTITGTITGDNGELINAGKVIFKLNGKTLKDSNGKVVYAKIINGSINSNVLINESILKDDNILTAVYSGSTGINQTKIQTSNITVKDEDVTLTINPINAKAGSDIKITVNVNATSHTVNEGKIVLKLNGKTLKDTNGKVIYAKVVNGIATVDYSILSTMKAKDYTLSAVFISNNYPKVSTESTLTIENN